MAPVHDAARDNDVEALRALLDADPGLIELQSEEWPHLSPLNIAGGHGHLEAARLLLDRGAQVDQPNAQGLTPLMRACGYGVPHMVSLLLSRGADPTRRGQRQETVLMYAVIARDCRAVDRAEVTTLLLRDGRVPVNGCEERGATALSMACLLGYQELVRLLLVEGGADPSIATEGGLTPMAVAKGSNHRNCARLLQWYEGEMEKAFLLTKARAVVDATECVDKSPVVTTARTRAGAQKAREAVTPACLKKRVSRGEALPVLELAGQQRVGRKRKDEAMEEERGAVLEHVVTWLKDDMLIELVDGIRFR